MGKFIKVYGINGLLEWHGYVVNGGVKMKVDFTNGSVTAFGVAPATFTTKDALTQHIIENSEQFKDGKIVIVRTVPIPGEEEPKAEPAVESEAPKQEDSAELTTINVSSNDEAKEYLSNNFGTKAIEMRTRSQIIAVGKSHNIEFVFG